MKKVGIYDHTPPKNGKVIGFMLLQMANSKKNKKKNLKKFKKFKKIELWPIISQCAMGGIMASTIAKYPSVQWVLPPAGTLVLIYLSGCQNGTKLLISSERTGPIWTCSDNLPSAICPKICAHKWSRNSNLNDKMQLYRTSVQGLEAYLSFQKYRYIPVLL